MSGTYADLEVWQAAMELAERVYRLTGVFPKEEKKNGTVSPAKCARSAVSVRPR